MGRWGVGGVGALGPQFVHARREPLCLCVCVVFSVRCAVALTTVLWGEGLGCGEV